MFFSMAQEFGLGFDNGSEWKGEEEGEVSRERGGEIILFIFREKGLFILPKGEKLRRSRSYVAILLRQIYLRNGNYLNLK